LPTSPDRKLDRPEKNPEPELDGRFVVDVRVNDDPPP